MLYTNLLDSLARALYHIILLIHAMVILKKLDKFEMLS